MGFRAGSGRSGHLFNKIKKIYFPGLVPGPAGWESSQVANEWQAPEFASLLRGKVVCRLGRLSAAYPPQAPPGYNRCDFALFDIVGPPISPSPGPPRLAGRQRVLAGAAGMTVGDR